MRWSWRPDAVRALITVGVGLALFLVTGWLLRSGEPKAGPVSGRWKLEAVTVDELRGDAISPVRRVGESGARGFILNGWKEVSLLQAGRHEIVFRWQEPRLPSGLWTQPRNPHAAGRLFFTYKNSEGQLRISERELDRNELRSYEPVRGQDNDGDGNVGLYIHVADILSGDGEDQLICGMPNDRDLKPRGVISFDRASGRRRWTYLSAQDPQFITVIGEGIDGSPNILMSGWAPRNGATVGDRSDSAACVVLLDAQGKERWYQEDTPDGSLSYATVASFSPEAPLCVVWMTTPLLSSSSRGSTVRVLEAGTGAIQATLSLGDGERPRWFVTADVTADGVKEILVGLEEGRVLALSDRVGKVAEYSWPGVGGVELLDVEDFDGDGFPEILGAAGHKLAVFSTGPKLELAAIVPEITLPLSYPSIRTPIGPAAVFRDDGGRTLVAVLDGVDSRLRVYSIGLRGILDQAGLSRGSAAIWALALLWGLAGIFLAVVWSSARQAKPSLRSVAEIELSKALWGRLSDIRHDRAKDSSWLPILAHDLELILKAPGPDAELAAELAEAVRGYTTVVGPRLDGLIPLVRQHAGALPEGPRLEARIRSLARDLRPLMLSSGRSEPDPTFFSKPLAALTDVFSSLSVVEGEVRSLLAVEAASAMTEAWRRYRPRLDRLGVHTRMEAALQSPVRVFCAAEDLASMLDQLLQNAIRHGLERVSNRQLLLRVSQRDGVTWFDIEDSGPGVSLQAKARILEPLLVTGLSGGYGLQRVRLLIWGYQGRLEIVSPAVLSGACFRLVLGLVAQEPHARESEG